MLPTFRQVGDLLSFGLGSKSLGLLLQFLFFLVTFNFFFSIALIESETLFYFISLSWLLSAGAGTRLCRLALALGVVSSLKVVDLDVSKSNFSVEAKRYLRAT